MPDNQRGGGRGVLWAAGALATCCTVHLLLLTGALTGTGAALAGVVAGNAVVVAVAGVVLAALVGVVIARRRRRPHSDGLPTGLPTDLDREERP